MPPKKKMQARHSGKDSRPLSLESVLRTNYEPPTKERTYQMTSFLGLNGFILEPEIFNFTEDAHPIRVHEVQFQVLNRQRFGRAYTSPPERRETGYKDVVIAYPGESPGSGQSLTCPGCLFCTATLWSMRITRSFDMARAASR